MSGLSWKECDVNWDKILKMAVCWLEDSQKVETFCADINIKNFFRQKLHLDSLLTFGIKIF